MDTYVSLPTLSNGNALPYLPERMILWTYEHYAADEAPCTTLIPVRGSPPEMIAVGQAVLPFLSQCLKNYCLSWEIQQYICRFENVL